MYIGNARTLKAILDQLSDTETFSEQRDKLLAEQQDRSFRFMLRFHAAENSFGYDHDHPLHEGYTITGELPDGGQQIRVALRAHANSFIESLQKGDTLEVIASLNRWDPAFNIVEMEDHQESPGTGTPTIKQPRENSGTAILAPELRAAIHPSPTGDLQGAPVSAAVASELPVSRPMIPLLTSLGVLGCIVTAILVFISSSTTNGWTETAAQLVYYKQKKTTKLITYQYTVNGKEYMTTIANEEHFGPAGNFLWISYRNDSPEVAKVSHRRSYTNIITVIAVIPFLLIFFIGCVLVIAQVTTASRGSTVGTAISS